MSEELIKIFDNLEAFHIGAAKEAAKAKKLLAGESKISSRKQRGRKLAAEAVARRLSRIRKPS